MREELQLESIRSNLIRQEETIIFALIERAQFRSNSIIYYGNAMLVPKFYDSFLMYMLHETEKVHARVRRYTAPDEHPFTENLPAPLLSSQSGDWPIRKTDINRNEEIYSFYTQSIIPMITEPGDCGNYGSSAVCDVASLQALSKRIHYGKYVAESKFMSDPEGYTPLIKAKDYTGILNKLTNKEVEKRILERVMIKASTYGQDPLEKTSTFKVNPEVIKFIYETYIIPLTKEVEYLYLIERLSDPV